MPARDFGPRTRRVYDTLLGRIRSGELAIGAQLPPHKQLAVEFGVAPMTIRQVLARLEDDGLVSRQVGRGTFVRPQASPTILVVARSPWREALLEQVAATGRAMTIACEPSQTLATLALESVSLVLIEVGADSSGVQLIRAVRQRWPRIAVAAVLASVTHLAPLQASPECPVLIVPAPPRAAQVHDVVHLALADATGGGGLARLEFQSRLLEAVEQAIVATDPSGQITYWNRGAERLYGWPADAVIGCNIGQVIVSAEMFEHGRDIMDRLRRGETWSGEFPVRRRDGSEVPVLVTDAPICDEHGNLVGIIGVAADLTERKRAERDRLQLAQLEAALTMAQRAHKELNQRLTLNVPELGRLASDPDLPAHLRPIAGVALQTIQHVATDLAQLLELPAPE